MVYRKAKTKFPGIHAGMLRNTISLHRVTKTPDGETGYLTKTENYADVWAMITYSNEMKDANGINIDDSARTKFTIRLRSDVTNKDYVQSGDEWFKVMQIERKSQNEDFLTLSCVPSLPNHLRDYTLVDSEGDEVGSNTGRPSTNENWSWPFEVI